MTGWAINIMSVGGRFCYFGILAARQAGKQRGILLAISVCYLYTSSLLEGPTTFLYYY